MTMYSWMVLIHVFAAILFFFSHGVSLATALLLKKQDSSEKMKMLLELPTVALIPMGVSMILLLGTSIYMGSRAGLWMNGWWLASFILFILMIVWMTWYSRIYYSPIRKALGMEYMTGFSTHNPAEPPVSMDEVKNLIARTNPHLILTVGFVVTIALLWLMRFKPF